MVSVCHAYSWNVNINFIIFWIMNLSSTLIVTNKQKKVMETFNIWSLWLYIGKRTLYRGKAFMFSWCCAIQMEVRTQEQTTNHSQDHSPLPHWSNYISCLQFSFLTLGWLFPFNTVTSRSIFSGYSFSQSHTNKI